MPACKFETGTLTVCVTVPLSSLPPHAATAVSATSIRIHFMAIPIS